MGFLGILLMIIFVVSALLLILIILVQEEGGDGLGGIFGGGGSSQVGNRSGNILTRITSVLATLFLISSLGLAWVNRTPDGGDVEAAARRLEAQRGDSVEWWVTDEDPASAGGE
ncbi:preprotein translocase subunit SecG [Alkalispirochaeta sphaeroplastigenens]|uniref:Protein-export membrane protein SecG n=2 Tax=Alkalispirochaeta sphaeroplastigenens TaxID=1187066 RepID=A0A2S4K0I4_9SPIO|nr:preprotein translocase subunit SecG [Alkalispirochaeta alkalica]POR05266.1 preprotein translocase subunit SecG [Alkalispirochaeta sphaeroplastigenens]